MPEAADKPALYLVSGSGMVAGGLLAIGLFTPLAVIAGGAAVVLIALNILSGCPSGGFDSRLGLIFGLAILLALALLGPGAYSIDARLFGFREIIIPRADRRVE